LTDINTGLGCPPYPHQFNDPEDEDRDGLRNVGIHKTEPPYAADSPKELHHKHQDLLAGKASNRMKSVKKFFAFMGTKFHHSTKRNATLELILIYFNPIHMLAQYYSKINFDITMTCVPRLPTFFPPFRYAN
jgi:hypothetical protein